MEDCFVETFAGIVNIRYNHEATYIRPRVGLGAPVEHIESVSVVRLRITAEKVSWITKLIRFLLLVQRHISLGIRSLDCMNSALRAYSPVKPAASDVVPPQELPPHQNSYFTL